MCDNDANRIAKAKEEAEQAETERGLREKIAPYVEPFLAKLKCMETKTPAVQRSMMSIPTDAKERSTQLACRKFINKEFGGLVGKTKRDYADNRQLIRVLLTALQEEEVVRKSQTLCLDRLNDILDHIAASLFPALFC